MGSVKYRVLTINPISTLNRSVIPVMDPSIGQIYMLKNILTQKHLLRNSYIQKCKYRYSAIL